MARAEPIVAEAKTSEAFMPAACIASISAYTLGPGAVPGLPMIVHATQLARAKEALLAGAHVLVHNVEDVPIDSEFIALARKNDAIVIPTLVVLSGYTDVFRGQSPAARYPLDCVDKVTRSHLETPIADNLRPAAARIARMDIDSVRGKTAHDTLIQQFEQRRIDILVGTQMVEIGRASCRERVSPRV